VVFVHGGPTSQAQLTFDPEKAYFTSRGIGVVDVNHTGSSGYGRAYRERLRGRWGLTDVADCVAAARALVSRGEADPARLAIRGGSAGGFTALLALTRTDVFAAATSYFGVTDLLALAAELPDFESGYLEWLVGPLPGRRAEYVERSPLRHAAHAAGPVLLLQGEEDEIVRSSQAHRLRRALEQAGVPHACLLLGGEQHGFRGAGTVATALEAELSLYAQVFGFEPDVPPLRLVTGSDGRPGGVERAPDPVNEPP
jgi:dipeptidyl aminopeptidase/acylaminoacyl peptidase